MSSVIGRVIRSRAGLLVFIVSAVALPFLIGEIESAAAPRPVQGLFYGDPANEAGEWTLETPWEELPGLAGSNARRPQSGIPIPSDDVELTASIDADGTVVYRFEYEDGALYEGFGTAPGEGQYRYSAPAKATRQRVLAAFAGLAAVLVLLGGASVWHNFSGRDPVAARLVKEIGLDPHAALLLTRWLQRSRYYRMLGGALGLAIYLGVNRLIINLNDVVMLVVLGVTLGGITSELRFSRKRRTGPVVVEVQARRLATYTSRTDDLLMVLVATMSIVVLVAGLSGVLSRSAAWTAFGTLLLFGFVKLAQRIVVLRARPALGVQMRQADDLLRYLAATQGFSRPAIAVGLFAVSSATVESTGSLSAVLSLVSFLSLLAGLGWLFIGRQSTMPKEAARVLAS